MIYICMYVCMYVCINKNRFSFNSSSLFGSDKFYARGVMVIVVGNGHGDTSSNPERDCLHFTLYNVQIPLGKL